MIGRTIFIMKDAKKGKVASNFRPNACLQLMWKLFTDIFAETIYNHFLHNPPPPNEKKGCREESRGVKDQLLIHKAFLQNYKRTCKNLAMGLTDYKNTYNMVPQSWLKEAMELVWFANNHQKLLFDSMERWKTIPTADNHVLGEVNIKKGILQGDTLSPLLFAIVLIPLSMILQEIQSGYQLDKHSIKINHLLFMDDLKLYERLKENSHILWTRRYDVWHGKM